MPGHLASAAAACQSPASMTAARPRIPVKPGYFTVPDEPGRTPELLCSRCRACGEYFFPRRLVCAKCLSRESEEVRVPARGTLYSFTFVHLPLFGSTGVEYREGYGVGQVDLPEGPRVQLPLAGRREELRVGQPVRGELGVLLEREGQEVVILRFRPVEA